MNRTVAGLFDTPAEAKTAVERVIEAGVPKENIGLACRDDQARDRSYESRESREGLSNLASNTTTGAMVGSLGGLLLGLGALAIPGIGPIIAAGPIAGALAGAGIGAAGGLMVATLRDSGIPEPEAHVYAESVRRGCTLVTVRDVGDDVAHRVCDIMDSAGAVDIEERAALLRSDGWSRFDHNAGPYTGERWKSGQAGRGRARQYTQSAPAPETVTTNKTGREVF